MSWNEDIEAFVKHSIDCNWLGENNDWVCCSKSESCMSHLSSRVIEWILQVNILSLLTPQSIKRRIKSWQVSLRKVRKTFSHFVNCLKLTWRLARHTAGPGGWRSWPGSSATSPSPRRSSSRCGCRSAPPCTDSLARNLQYWRWFDYLLIDTTTAINIKWTSRMREIGKC